jgi:hypothetical protein
MTSTVTRRDSLTRAPDPAEQWSPREFPAVGALEGAAGQPRRHLATPTRVGRLNRSGGGPASLLESKTRSVLSSPIVYGPVA